MIELFKIGVKDTFFIWVHCGWEEDQPKVKPEIIIHEGLIKTINLCDEYNAAIQELIMEIQLWGTIMNNYVNLLKNYYSLEIYEIPDNFAYARSKKDMLLLHREDKIKDESIGIDLTQKITPTVREDNFSLRIAISELAKFLERSVEDLIVSPFDDISWDMSWYNIYMMLIEHGAMTLLPFSKYA